MRTFNVVIRHWWRTLRAKEAIGDLKGNQSVLVARATEQWVDRAELSCSTSFRCYITGGAKVAMGGSEVLR